VYWFRPSSTCSLVCDVRRDDIVLLDSLQFAKHRHPGLQHRYHASFLPEAHRGATTSFQGYLFAHNDSWLAKWRICIPRYTARLANRALEGHLSADTWIMTFFSMLETVTSFYDVLFPSVTILLFLPYIVEAFNFATWCALRLSRGQLWTGPRYQDATDLVSYIICTAPFPVALPPLPRTIFKGSQDLIRGWIDQKISKVDKWLDNSSARSASNDEENLASPAKYSNEESQWPENLGVEAELKTVTGHPATPSTEGHAGLQTMWNSLPATRRNSHNPLQGSFCCATRLPLYDLSLRMCRDEIKWVCKRVARGSIGNDLKENPTDTSDDVVMVICA
jgi:hypothetical protein